MLQPQQTQVCPGCLTPHCSSSSVKEPTGDLDTQVKSRLELTDSSLYCGHRGRTYYHTVRMTSEPEPPPTSKPQNTENDRIAKRKLE